MYFLLMSYIVCRVKVVPRQTRQNTLQNIEYLQIQWKNVNLELDIF